MPSIGVNICVIKSRKILLTKREDFEVWCLPGGAVDPGETIHQAAVREVCEETGLIVELSHLVGIYSNPHSSVHIVLFSANPVGGEMKLDPNEVVEMDYFSPQNLPKDIIPWHKQRIFDARMGKTGVVWSQKGEWPFESELSSGEVYLKRDQSGLPRKEFFFQYLVNSDNEPIMELKGQYFSPVA